MLPSKRSLRAPQSHREGWLRMPLQSLIKTARFAVEEELRLTDFIRTCRRQICQSIEDSERGVSGADCHSEEAESNMVFVAECLPLAACIVHAGASRADFRRAVEWVSESKPNADPVLVLSALTFIYLVQEGLEDSQQDCLTWKRIRRRVNNFLINLSSAPPQSQAPGVACR